jgi:hypothetical protein
MTLRKGENVVNWWGNTRSHCLESSLWTRLWICGKTGYGVNFRRSHKDKSNKMQQCIKLFNHYSIFIWSSTCFGRHTTHYQEPKTALAASGFSQVEACWKCSWWTLSGTLCLTTSTNYTSNNFPRMKNRGCQCSFKLLIMGGVSPETCWVSYKYGIIKK